MATDGFSINRSTICLSSCASNPISKAVLLRKTIPQGRCLIGLISILAFIGPLTVTEHPTQALQTVSTSEPRPNPQPWRPAFGDYSKNPNPTNPPNRFADSSGAAPLASSSQPQSQPASQPASGTGVVPPAVLPGEEKKPAPAAQPIQSQPSAETDTGGTKVSRTFESLPNTAGQVWREYDLTPYTSQITNSDNPQQAVIDWILKETGTEIWFNQPLGILSATKNQLYVYHTPEIQTNVKRLLDRFIYSRGRVQSMEVTLLTVDNPNWRSSAYKLMQSIEAKSLGVEAFILSKENAAILINQLSRQGDGKVLTSGTVNNHEGQPFLLRNIKQTQFFSSIQWIPNQNPGYQPVTSNVNEGYSVSVNCLTGLDGKTVESIIKCDIDQIEKLSNVRIEAPMNLGNLPQPTVQVPQIVSWRLHERFRWSGDQVLLLTCGVVSGIDTDKPRGPILPVLANNLRTKRADALLFIDYRGPVAGGTQQAANPGLAPLQPRR